MSKKQKLNLVLNEIRESDDPTIVPCTFIILDYDVSGNNVVVSKDIALEAGKTLINKPIVAKYNEVEEANTPTDNFTSHEQHLGEDRYGNTTIKTDTVPLGVFTTEGYNLTINVDGEDKEVMAADAVIWRSRFPDATDLLLEWYENGVQINTSCEYLYSNFGFVDGVEYHYSPIYFEGQALLASENRGDQTIVAPAYKSATLLSFNEVNQFNRLVAQAINQNNEIKESEKMPEFFKKVCELSHDDIRSLIYTSFDSTLGEHDGSWLADVYETYFIMNVYNYSDDNSFDKYFKYNYTRNDTSVAIDFDTKKEVFITRNWEEVVSEEIQNQLNDKDTKIVELETQVNTISTEKTEIETKFNETAETLTQLSAEVDTLKPFKVQVEQEKMETALNEKKDFYSEKFKALNAVEKFESEEVQNLVAQSIDESNGKDAILQLNTMLVDLVVLQKETAPSPTFVKEVASKRENLIPNDDSFDSRYGL